MSLRKLGSGRRWAAALVTIAIGCMAAASLGARYVWVGNGADADWDTCDNWSGPTGFPCYPSTTSDDAEIPFAAGVWDVNLVDEQIDNLSILANVNFTNAAGSTGLLDVFTLHVDAADAEVVLTMGGTAELTVVPQP